MRIVLLGLMAIALAAFPEASDAATSNVFNAGGGVGAEIESETGLGNTNPATATATIINVVLSFLALILIVLFVYAGALWMTAAGNEDKIGKAKTILTSAVIGLFIVLLSAALTRLLLTEATEATGTNIEFSGGE